jgi:aspartate/methionine/tyrosine aminotransferase
MSCPLFLARLLIRTRLANWLPSVRRLVDGGGGFLRYYSDRMVTSPVLELKSAARLLERHACDAVNLAMGEPHFDLLPSGSTKLPADQRGWPSPNGLPELRTAVAEKLHSDNGLTVHPQDEVLITHGATGAFYTALDTFVDPGDKVVLFDPTSPLFALAAKHRRARVRWVNTWMEDGRTRFRLAHVARALRGAKMLILNTPANPTGGVLTLDDLEQIAWWANRHDVLIYSDEAFERYQYEGEHISISFLPQAGQRTLTVGSLSKGHALTAARVGWLAGCRHLVRPCAVTAALQSPFVPTLCQQIGLTALQQESKYFEPIRAGFEYRRRYAFERLQAMGLNPSWPGGGFFLWMPVWDRDMSGEVFADRLLREKKLLVTPGDLFGPSGKGYVRLSFATEDGRLREGLRRLAEFVDPQNAASTPANQAA